MIQSFFSKDFLAKIAVVLAFLSLPITVFAADTTARQVINAGSITISAPTLEAFSNVSVSLSAQVQSLTFSTPVTVTDLRGSSSTFTAQVTTTQFSDGGSNTISTDKLKYSSNAASSPSGDTTTGITVTSTPTAFDGASPSAAQTVMSKNNSDKVGSWQVTPTLELTIPAQQEAGTYNATNTYTVS